MNTTQTAQTTTDTTAFTRWLDTFLSEKGIDLDDTFEVGGDWGSNYMSYAVVVQTIKAAPMHEQAAIKAMCVKIDFVNGDIGHFLRHLAKAIAL